MTMWYLVVPPIVVVLSLSFLLWYLSRKGSDPAIALKVLAGEVDLETVSFPRTKEFFLKILEKFGQRFKVGSLRAHNVLHEFTQSVKASRMKVHMAATSQSHTQKVNHEGVIDERDDEAEVVFGNHASPQDVAVPLSTSVEKKSIRPEEILATPIVRKERSGMRTASMGDGMKKEVLFRPMISEVAVHPEIKKRVSHADTSREESLIAHIAKDPKNFIAYEELGDYYLETGNIKDAKECYRQVLKLSPVHRMVKIKIRRLEKLLTRGGE